MKKNRNLNWLTAASAAVLTLVVYFTVLQNDFVDWDDTTYVVENPFIRALNLRLLKWAFLDFYALNWHPLTWISHAADYAVWGLNPFGHHLTSILLHAVNTFLVVVLVIAILELARERAAETRVRDLLDNRTILTSAAMTGFLFGLHPVHVESVAWVSERKDLLCALFFLLSLIMYAKYVRTVPGRSRSFSFFFNPRYLATFVFFVLALLSKPMAVTLPVVLLILDWYPWGRIPDMKSFRSAVAEKVPFLTLALFSSAVTLLAQKAGHAVVPIESIGLPTRLFVAAKALSVYLGKMILPRNLLPFYPYPPHSALLSISGILAVSLTSGITLGGLIEAKKQKAWLSAWAYFVVTLIPVLGIVQVGRQSMADRYTYLPSLAPFLIASLAAARFRLKMMIGEKRFRGLRAFSAAAAAVLVLTCLSLLTVRQIAVWKNSFTLWDYEIEREPRAATVYNNRGIAFQRIGSFERAIEDYETAFSLEPSYAEALFNQGTAYEKTGEFQKALADYDRAIAVNPSYQEAYLNRGVLFKKSGLLAAAIENFNKSIALSPSSDKGYFFLGMISVESGSYAASIAYFSRAVAVNPDNDEAYINRGTVYAMQGQPDKAFADFNQAMTINKNNPVTYYNRGRLQLLAGNRENAVSDLRKACDLGYEDGCRDLNGKNLN